MKIYGYFVTWTDYTDSKSHKDYGFVAANSRAEAIENVEEQYEGEYASVDEIGISSVTGENDNPVVLDHYQIGFFLDAMKQNGYDEEGN